MALLNERPHFQICLRRHTSHCRRLWCRRNGVLTTIAHWKSWTVTRNALCFPLSIFSFISLRIDIARQRAYQRGKRHVQLALEAATKDHSGFRYLPKLGLVSKKHDKLLGRLKKFCDA